MSDKKKAASGKVTKKYIDLLYMTSEQITAKEISTVFEDITGLTVELWTEMNILELVLSNGNSVDFEPLDIDFKNESDTAFVKNRNINTIFAISLCEADLPTMIPYFNHLVASFSGFICEDSEDFSPVYAGSANQTV
jgi:hypothetical protein